MESSLALALSDYEAKVGAFLGFGRGADAGDTTWSSRQQADISDCVQSGLRQFYWPPTLPGEAHSYDWSFLKPTASLALASGAQTVALPEDFGGLQGRVTVTSEDSEVFEALDVTGEGRLREAYAAQPEAAGRPLRCAIRPLKGTTLTKGQRFELFVFPQADEAYTLSLAYTILPDYLTGQTPYAYGGAAHAETILESCLAVAERRLDDAMQVHSVAFMERLAASISHDRKLKPQLLGYNGDRSDRRHHRGRRRGWWPNVATINGVEPD